MIWLVEAIATGITAFIATNIDDIVILMLFFTQINANFRAKHIVIGQYLGFIVLLAASLPGFFGGLIIPKAWIGLLGILPIAIGIHHLFNRDDEVQTVSKELQSSDPKPSWRSAIANRFPPQVYHVAAVTFANGGDNIGIYVPLFASSDGIRLIVLLSVFLVLVGVWCYVAHALAHHPSIAPILSRYAHYLVPFVLIGLGIYILIENGTYQLITQLGSR